MKKLLLEQLKKDVYNLEIEKIEGWISAEEIKRNPLWNELISSNIGCIFKT